MKITKHAQKRMRQRGFPGLAVSIIEHYGTPSNALGGAIKVVLSNKGRQDAISEAKHFIQQLDSVKGGTIIIKEDRALTLYKKTAL